MLNWELLTTNIVTAKHIKSVAAFIIVALNISKIRLENFVLQIAETKWKSQTVEIRPVKCGLWRTESLVL